MPDRIKDLINTLYDYLGRNSLNINEIMEKSFDLVFCLKSEINSETTLDFYNWLQDEYNGYLSPKRFHDFQGSNIKKCVLPRYRIQTVNPVPSLVEVIAAVKEKYERRQERQIMFEESLKSPMLDYRSVEMKKLVDFLGADILSVCNHIRKQGSILYFQEQFSSDIPSKKYTINSSDLFNNFRLELKQHIVEIGFQYDHQFCRNSRIYNQAKPVFHKVHDSYRVVGSCNEEYEVILRIIRETGECFQRAPNVYKDHDEEDLRHFLVSSLSGNYSNKVTPETFNKKGKTDIYIPLLKNAAFIAECKIWHGEKLMLEAINQLLSYLTWKNNRVALIIFNKEQKSFMALLKKIPAYLKAHPGYIEDTFIEIRENEWESVIKSEEDTDCCINMRTFLFNLYCE